MKAIALAAALLTFGAVQAQEASTVYFTSEITPEALVKIYKALGVDAQGNVAVKISTGESEHSNHLRPEFIAPLVKEVNGTLVECNTAYPGNRNTTEKHRRAIAERGYDKIAVVDIMDADGSMPLPMQDSTYFNDNLVGKHLANYDFMINLAHFKGHQMGGFGGVLKNQSIGVASSEGKALIHTVGKTSDPAGLWDNLPEQDQFLESMAGAAQTVDTYFKGKKGIVYINVMNNMSVDCDCNGHPEAAKLKDMGILASLDPVALDQACLDLVFNHASTEGDDSKPLIQRINRQHGTHIVDYAEKLGLGTKKYTIVPLD
ncbi:MAG: DUF362 domain-containing protein [Bacteroidales bacterium]|nr:DUF362 domain-containing protein [Bacteroidales bacterium]